MQPDTPNQSHVAEFVLLGFAEAHEPLFLFILSLTHLLTLVENSAIVLVVGLDHRLHRPMYFFLTHLSCLEIGYRSVAVPKMLAGFLGVAGGQGISYGGCLSQLFIFTFLGATECLLLAAMAYTDTWPPACLCGTGAGVLGRLLAGGPPHPRVAHLPHVPTDALWPQRH